MEITNFFFFFKKFIIKKKVLFLYHVQIIITSILINKRIKNSFRKRVLKYLRPKLRHQGFRLG